MMVLTKEIREAVKDRDRRIEVLEKALSYVLDWIVFDPEMDAWCSKSGYDPNVASDAFNGDWKDWPAS